MSNEDPFSLALSLSLRYLAIRPHSIWEMKNKLGKKGFSRENIDGVIKYLQERRYIDDLETATRWAVHLVENRRWGKSKLRQYLLKKGIDRDIITRVEELVWNQFEEEAVARQAIKKKYRYHTGQPDKNKTACFLKSRGFSMEVIYRIISETD